MDTIPTAGTVTLSITVEDAGGTPVANPTVSWTSSDTGVATVDAAGVVTGVGPGEATITATVDGVTATSTIFVFPAFTVTVNPTAVNLLSIGATQAIAVTVTDSEGNTVTNPSITFTTSDAAVATVGTDGTITAVAGGTATITATFESVSATVAVTVTPTPATVNVTPVADTIDIAGTSQLSAAVLDAGGTVVAGASVEWSSSAEGVATVDATGLVTGVSGGTAVVTATSGSASGSATIEVRGIDVTIQNDTTLTGPIAADEFTVATGTTVTLGGDFSLTATGPVVIDGTLSGTCAEANIQSSDSVRITGTLNLPCATEGKALTITGEGGITLLNSTLTTSGRVLLRTDPALNDTTDLSAGAFGASRRGALREEITPGLTLINVMKMPERAPAGTEASPNGANGENTLILSNGALVIGGSIIEAQGGGNGFDHTVTGTSPSAQGGNGGMGGSLIIGVRGGVRDAEGTDFGDLVNSANAERFQGGYGGIGGHGAANAIGTNSGAVADGATAAGGRGGDGGGIIGAAGTTITAEASSVFRPGGGGWGGDATATGADGVARGAEGAQKGGPATVSAGTAGANGIAAWNSTIQNVDAEFPPRAGSETADPGRGGPGVSESLDGGAGGDAIFTDRPRSWRHFGGNGGDGFPYCPGAIARRTRTSWVVVSDPAGSVAFVDLRGERDVDGNIVEAAPGGNGGPAGMVTGISDPTRLTARMALNGGDGAAGTPGGTGGTATVLDGAFRDSAMRPGTDGPGCPSSGVGIGTPTVSVTTDLTTGTTQVTLTSAAPFITVSGTLGDDGALTATGTGTMNGVPGVTVVFQGTYDSATGAISGNYSMDTEKVIVSGHPLVYGISTVN